MPLPAPRVWNDEDLAMAADYNLDWRDSFDFLRGYTKPMFLGRSGVAQTLAAGTEVAINITSEILKRGGIVHSTSTNAHLIQVPYTGQYQGMMMGGFQAIASLPARMNLYIHRISSAVDTTIARDNGPYTSTGASEIAGTFTADLLAGDQIYLSLRSSQATSSAITGLTQPRIAVWYAGDYQ